MEIIYKFNDLNLTLNVILNVTSMTKRTYLIKKLDNIIEILYLLTIIGKLQGLPIYRTVIGKHTCKDTVCHAHGGRQSLLNLRPPTLGAGLAGGRRQVYSAVPDWYLPPARPDPQS